MERKVIIVSEDEEFYESLNRAFKAFLDIEVIKLKKSFGREMDIILYCLNNGSKDFGNWLCGVFRKKSCNPLVVLGVMDKESFIRENPVFRDYPYNHAYIPIPFKLQQIMDTLNTIKPIYDEVTRKFIIKDYCKNYEYTLITHELKIIDDDKIMTINNIEKVKDFYKGKGDKDKVNFLTEKMEKIKVDDGWLSIAIDLKQRLANDLGRRGESYE